MPPINSIRLSDQPGFIPCKPGEHLTDEQHRRIFSSSDAFWRVVLEAVQTAHRAPAADPQAVSA